MSSLHLAARVLYTSGAVFNTDSGINGIMPVRRSILLPVFLFGWHIFRLKLDGPSTIAAYLRCVGSTSRFDTRVSCMYEILCESCVLSLVVLESTIGVTSSYCVHSSDTFNGSVLNNIE
jgi:hypothetical protein